MESLLDIDRTGTDPSEYVRAKLAARERVMGFGHRVYKTMDPRATLLREMVEAVSEERDSRKWYDMSVKIRSEERRVGKEGGTRRQRKIQEKKKATEDGYVI